MIRRLNIDLIYLLILLLLISLLYFKNKNIDHQHLQFQINNNSYSELNKAYFESYLIQEPKFLKVSHASSVEVLNNGDLISVWFAGSHEGKPDVKIWQSKFHNGNWSYAIPIITRQSLTNADGRFASKLGNPVIYLDHNNILHIFVVSVGLIGGWSGSNLNHFISIDNGTTWQFVGKLYLSPFANNSTLDRTHAINLTNGGFYLPVYHEMIRKYPEILYFDANAHFVSQIRLTSRNSFIQPAILPINKNMAFAYLRNSSKQDHHLYYQTTQDGGLTWSDIKQTNLNNRDSSVVVARLGDFKYLMVHNDIQGRNKLYLSWSTNGYNWKNIYLIENAPQKEFSYPAIQIKNDFIDITYTYNRSAIKHLRFNQKWLFDKVQGI